MNEALKQKAADFAFQLALSKANSTGIVSEAEFSALKERTLKALEGVVDAVNAGTQLEPWSAPKRAKAPRKEGTPAPGGRSGIDPEALRAFLAHKVKLDEIAAHFSVSKGVAQRAVVALGDAVKDEPAPKEAGKRGKPAIVYWIA